MTTMNSRMLVAVVTTATLAMGGATAKADHYRRSYGGGYRSYAPAYYSPAYYAPPVAYAPAYGCAPYRPVAYVQPAYYPRYYAPAPVYRPYYPSPRYGFGFGYSQGGCGGYGGYGGYRGHGGGFSFHVGGR